MQLIAHLWIAGTIFGIAMAYLDPGVPALPCARLQCLTTDDLAPAVCGDVGGVPVVGHDDECCLPGNRQTDYGTYCYNHGGRDGEKRNGVFTPKDGLVDYCKTNVDQCKPPGQGNHA